MQRKKHSEKWFYNLLLPGWWERNAVNEEGDVYVLILEVCNLSSHLDVNIKKGGGPCS